MNENRRIFLSHKSENKSFVREYKLTLEQLGMQPWLDEDDIPAGEEIERAIMRGMQESCAAIFFVTPDYKDDKHVRAEINYAIAEKRKRGDAFVIITLVFKSPDGRIGTVPELLEPYVWKQPSSDLQGLQEILKALPEKLSKAALVSKVSEVPNVRVRLIPGSIHSEPPSVPETPILMVRLENCDSQTLYLSGGVSMSIKSSNEKAYWVGYDASSKMWYRKTALAPGDAYQVNVHASEVLDIADDLLDFFFTDEIGRKFYAGKEETEKALAELKA